MPLDDTNTMLIELRHVSETEGTTPAVVGRPQHMLPGQTRADTYEESQRQPGDFEAQVSQRPIAVHGLEHLGDDRSRHQMFRNQMRAASAPCGPARTPAGLCATTAW